jgi:CRP/FNR family transcriptional regulator, cyclic AMP receptor protein
VICHSILQRDLAAMAGVARENVNRALAEWKRRKVVTRISDQYCIQDAAALRLEVR